MTDERALLDDPPPVGSGRPRRRATTVLVGIAVIALLGGWVYVLFVYDPGRMIDELPDRTFPDRAEQVCAAAKAQLDDLPPAQTADSAAERAGVVAGSNVVLAAMVRELRDLVPAVPAAQRAGVSEWVDDWAVYLEDRREYVDNLRADEEARFLETPKGSPTKGITRAINGFAEVNRMESCTTPADLA